MLDGSYDVNDEEWDKSLNFTCSMASQCSISPDETRVGFSIYSDHNEIGCGFGNASSYEEFKNIAYDSEKPESTSKSYQINLHYSRVITSKCITNGGAHLCGLAPRLHSTQLRRNVAAVANRWRHCADLTDPGIESLTSRTDKVCA